MYPSYMQVFCCVMYWWSYYSKAPQTSYLVYGNVFFFLTKVVIAQTNQESASIIFEIRAYVYVMYNGENRYKDVSVFLS